MKQICDLRAFRLCFRKYSIVRRRTTPTCEAAARRKRLRVASLPMAPANEAHLGCMKNEAGLRPMKRAFGSRRSWCALCFMAATPPLHRSRKASASCSRSECFINSTPSARFGTKALRSSRFYAILISEERRWEYGRFIYPRITNKLGYSS